MSTCIENMLATGALEKHIRDTLIPSYSLRYYAMVDAVKEHLEPLGVRISSGKPYVTSQFNAATASGQSDNKACGGTRIAGGFFLLLTLPENLPSATTLAKVAIDQHDLKFAHGKMFEVKGDPGSKQRSDATFGRTIRLCWAFHEAGVIVEGIKRMKLLLSEHLPA